jgi:ATP-dependent helicase/nuclease subunit A
MPPTGLADQAQVPDWPVWQAPVQAPAVGAEDLHSARLGQAVHRVLEWAAQGPWSAEAGSQAGQQDGGLERLADAAAAAFQLAPQDATAVARMAGAVLHSPACRRFFDAEALLWAGNEVPVAWQGQVLRVDRLVAVAEPEGTCWWVLDYKLQTRPAAVDDYREQLLTYVAAVQALQPADRVRGAFITGQGQLVLLDRG